MVAKPGVGMDWRRAELRVIFYGEVVFYGCAETSGDGLR
jgi:hypothetical protein